MLSKQVLQCQYTNKMSRHDTYGDGSNSSSSIFFTSVLAYLTFYQAHIHEQILFDTFWLCRFSPTCSPFFALSQTSGRGSLVVVVVLVLVMDFQSWGLSRDFSIRRKRRTRFISSCRGWNSGSIVFWVSVGGRTWNKHACQTFVFEGT